MLLLCDLVLRQRPQRPDRVRPLPVQLNVESHEVAVLLDDACAGRAQAQKRKDGSTGTRKKKNGQRRTLDDLLLRELSALVLEVYDDLRAARDAVRLRDAVCARAARELRLKSHPAQRERERERLPVRLPYVSLRSRLV